MVLAPICLSLPFFFGTILVYQAAGTYGNSYYEGAFTSFFGGVGMLIVFGSYFRKAIKRYLNHQATKDEVNTYRLVYYGLYIASLVFDFMTLAYLLYGPKF